MDDLVVGAPLEWNEGHGSGAVYIYLNTINVSWVGGGKRELRGIRGWEFWGVEGTG